MQDRIDAVHKIGQLTIKSTVCVWSFISTVTFYKSMCPCWLHILAPLHNLTGTGKFEWGPCQTKAILTMKAMIVIKELYYSLVVVDDSYDNIEVIINYQNILWDAWLLPILLHISLVDAFSGCFCIPVSACTVIWIPVRVVSLACFYWVVYSNRATTVWISGLHVLISGFTQGLNTPL